jgi:hypothetical protein
MMVYIMMAFVICHQINSGMNNRLNFSTFERVEALLETKLMHPVIYVDLDGTLCDFESRAAELLGKDFKSTHSETEFWKALAPPRVKNFFGTLDWMPGAKDVWARIKPFKPTVLTATGNTWAVPQKHQWVARELGSTVHVIITRSTQKSKYAGPKKILIDDRADIIKRWKDAGGIGIRYNTAAQVLEKLNAILP